MKTWNRLNGRTRNLCKFVEFNLALERQLSKAGDRLL